MGTDVEAQPSPCAATPMCIRPSWTWSFLWPHALPRQELATDAQRHDVDDDRHGPDEHAVGPDLRRVADAEPHRHPIGRPGHEHEEHPRREGEPEPGAARVVAWPLEQVVERVVAAQLALR